MAGGEVDRERGEEERWLRLLHPIVKSSRIRRKSPRIKSSRLDHV
jgi:hypothetical protein